MTLHIFNRHFYTRDKVSATLCFPGARLCGTNHLPYPGSSVVGTTSSAVGPFTPALLPLQFLRGTDGPHRPAKPSKDGEMSSSSAVHIALT